MQYGDVMPSSCHSEKMLWNPSIANPPNKDRSNLSLSCCRWMNETIITIREASWLTDHTYTYDEVVRMMGELVAVFRGDLRVRVRVKWERREGLVQAVRISCLHRVIVRFLHTEGYSVWLPAHSPEVGGGQRDHKVHGLLPVWNGPPSYHIWKVGNDPLYIHILILLVKHECTLGVQQILGRKWSTCVTMVAWFPG